MGNIYIGTSRIKNVYLGATKAKKIYLGTSMVWQSAIPVARPTSEQLNPSAVYTGNPISNGFSMPGVEYVRGDISGTTVSGGPYVAYYRPDAEHVWADTEDRAEVAVTLTITKAAGFVNLSASTLSVGTRKTGSFNINSSHGGALSVSCSGSVSAYISGSTVVVTGAYSPGSGSVTVSCAATENYNAASATVSVSVYQSTISFTVHGRWVGEDDSGDYDHYFTANYYNTFRDILPTVGSILYSTNRPWVAPGYGNVWGYIRRDSNDYVIKTLDGSSYESYVYINRGYPAVTVELDTPIVDGAYYYSSDIYV